MTNITNTIPKTLDAFCSVLTLFLCCFCFNESFFSIIRLVDFHNIWCFFTSCCNREGVLTDLMTGLLGDDCITSLVLAKLSFSSPLRRVSSASWLDSSVEACSGIISSTVSTLGACDDLNDVSLLPIWKSAGPSGVWHIWSSSWSWLDCRDSARVPKQFGGFGQLYGRWWKSPRASLRRRERSFTVWSLLDRLMFSSPSFNWLGSHSFHCFCKSFMVNPNKIPIIPKGIKNALTDPYMMKSLLLRTHWSPLRIFRSFTKPRIIIGLEIANDKAQTRVIFSLTPVFDRFLDDNGDLMAMYRSKDMVHRCKIDDVHIKTSDVTKRSQTAALRGQ